MRRILDHDRNRQAFGPISIPIANDGQVEGEGRGEKPCAAVLADEISPREAESRELDTKNECQLSQAMTYQMVRHLIFIFLFDMVFICVICDFINRYREQHGQRRIWGCSSTYAATVAISSVGIFTAIAFLRRPSRCFVKLSQQEGQFEEPLIED